MGLVIELAPPPELRQEIGEARLLPGPKGDAATIAVGEVLTGDSAAVTNSGDGHDAVFNFVLPR